MVKSTPPIGRRIKEAREAAGLTQQELAVKAGLSVSNLAQIEQGQKEDPRISTMLALARALGVGVGQLAGEDAHPERGARPTDDREAAAARKVAPKKPGRRPQRE